MLIVGDGQVRVVDQPVAKPRLIGVTVVFGVIGIIFVVAAVLGLSGHLDLTDRTGEPLGPIGRAVEGGFLAILGVIFLCGAALGAYRLAHHTDLELFVLDQTQIRTPMSTVPLAEVTSIDVTVDRRTRYGRSLRGRIRVHTPRRVVTSGLPRRDVSDQEFERLGRALHEVGRQHGFPILDDQGDQARDLR